MRIQLGPARGRAHREAVVPGYSATIARRSFSSSTTIRRDCSAMPPPDPYRCDPTAWPAQALHAEIGGFQPGVREQRRRLPSSATRPCSITCARPATASDCSTFCSTSRIESPSACSRPMRANNSSTSERREAQRGLVEDQQLRTAHQPAADRDHLLLAAAHRARPSGPARSREPREGLRRGVQRIGAVGAAAEIGPEQQVVPHRQVRENLAAFGHVDEAGADDGGGSPSPSRPAPRTRPGRRGPAAGRRRSGSASSCPPRSPRATPPPPPPPTASWIPCRTWNARTRRAGRPPRAGAQPRAIRAAAP